MNIEDFGDVKTKLVDNWETLVDFYEFRKNKYGKADLEECLSISNDESFQSFIRTLKALSHSYKQETFLNDIKKILEE